MPAPSTPSFRFSSSFDCSTESVQPLFDIAFVVILFQLLHCCHKSRHTLSSLYLLHHATLSHPRAQLPFAWRSRTAFILPPPPPTGVVFGYKRCSICAAEVRVISARLRKIPEYIYAIVGVRPCCVLDKEKAALMPTDWWPAKQSCKEGQTIQRAMCFPRGGWVFRAGGGGGQVGMGRTAMKTLNVGFCRRRRRRLIIVHFYGYCGNDHLRRWHSLHTSVGCCWQWDGRSTERLNGRVVKWPTRLSKPCVLGTPPRTTCQWQCIQGTWPTLRTV